MKRKIVRFLYRIGLHKLAHLISPSFYWKCAGEDLNEVAKTMADALQEFATICNKAIPWFITERYQPDKKAEEE